MDTTDVARALSQIAALLELKGENLFRVRAYRTAARTIAAYPGELRAACASGALAETRGIGPATLEIIEELLATGRCRMLDDLRDAVPPGLADMLQLAGLGVGRIRQVHESLHIDSVAELEAAARDGRLAALPRFGRKTAEKILKGIAFLHQTGGYRLCHHAQAEADALAAVLGGMPGVGRVEVAGSLRRRCELIRDVDLVVALDGPPEGLVGRLRTAPGVREFAHPSARAVTFRFGGGTMADLYLAPPAQFGLHLLRATGTSAHLDALAVRVAERGLRWTADALCRDDDPLPTPTEEAVYAALDLPWIPPELRESGEEVAAASRGALPDLVSRSDLRGFLHCHSSYSDGMNSVAEWAAAAHAAGYTYLGITDHSPATAFAGGIQLREIERQHAEIDAVNRAAPGVRLFKGVEADILETGALDYTPRVRRTFDFIIASVHTRFGMDAEQMTARVLTAMDDPTMTILGHPTGRLLLSRDPYPLDLDRVFARAAERGIAIEINADPQRLDLDWRVLRQAAAAGVTISIGADAHGVAHMHHADLGVGIARKGWLSKDQILNVRPAEEFLAFARRRRR